jgi:type VI secretion system protein ImpE
MSLAETLLRQGDLSGARAELVELVKKTPGNQEARMFLFQLLCLTGEWTKARAQLAAMAQLSPEAQMLSVAYGQAIDAEIARADAFAGKAPVALLVKAQPWAADLVTALGHELAGRTSEAEAARGRAFEAAPDTPGSLDGTDFDWIADGDSRFGPSIEAIIAGKWGILPFDTLEYVRSKGPSDLRDTVWYPVEIGFRSGTSVAGFLPVRYPGSETSSETSDILARSTRWVETSLGETGLGQHVLNLSGGDERDLLSLRKLEFK